MEEGEQGSKDLLTAPLLREPSPTGLDRIEKGISSSEKTDGIDNDPSDQHFDPSPSLPLGDEKMHGVSRVSTTNVEKTGKPQHMNAARKLLGPSGGLHQNVADGRSRHPRPSGIVRRIAPGQPAPPNRIKDRFVSLPDELRGPPEGQEISDEPAAGVPTIFEDLLVHGREAGLRGRITAYCVAESLDRKVLEALLRDQDSTKVLRCFEDVVYTRFESRKGNAEPLWGDIFYFDFGVIVFWNLEPSYERTLIRTLATPAMIDPLPAMEVEVEEFAFNYTATDKPHIQNDTFTINYRLAGDHLLKLSISYALAQSTKLTVYEQGVVEIVEETRDLPEILASTGHVDVSRKKIAQLMGRVFIQKSAVNLLSTVLDTPEFFWSAPDAMQVLYKSSCEYLEFFNRVEVLNSRFSVLQEMLEMIRDHQNNYHTARLEWIVIWLIVIEVVVGLFECLSMAGWLGPGESS